MRRRGCAAGCASRSATCSRPGPPCRPTASRRANGSARFKSIVRRQVQSLDYFRLPVRFYRRSAFGSSLGRDRIKQTYEREWPKIRREIDEGRLAMLGLIRVAGKNPFGLTGNHQVIAYGYAEDGRGVTLRIYDPNWPDNDNVTAVLRLDEAFRPTSLASSTGEPLLGYFLAPVQARRHPRLALRRR